MNELTAITSILSSIKTATDLAKVLKEAKTTVEEAEVKLQLAELITALAEAKINIADIKSELINKNAEIEGLKKQLDMKAKFTFKKPFYYQEGDDQPFCPKCWEKDEKTIHLSGPDEFSGGTAFKCSVCENLIFTNQKDISLDDIGELGGLI